MATPTVITASSSNGSSHRPAIYPKYKYDITTQKASVTWTASGGHFSYSYLQFGVRMRRKVNGKWKYTNTLIGGMSGANYVEKWRTSGSASKTVKYGSNTQICFVARCSAGAEGGHCDAGWGSSWTRDTGWKNLLTETKEVKISIKDGEYHVREFDNVEHKSTSKYSNKIVVHWELEGLGCHKLVAAIYDANDNLISMPYTKDNPKAFSKATNSGDITFSGLTTATWYIIKIAVANTDVGESIADNWEDDCVEKKLCTREEAPYVYFKNGVSLGTTATVYFEAILPSVGWKRRLYSLAYTVHDDTTNTNVITNRYVFKEVESDVAVMNGNAYGTFTITGLTAGHDYTVTPTVGITTVHGIAMAQAYSTKIVGAIAPQITSITNSGSNLIFGEPDGNPRLDIGISGTAGVWTITLKAGTSISNGIVSNPIFSVNGTIGTNYCGLTDSALDTIYKTINSNSQTTIYVSIEYYLTSGGGSAGTSYKSAVMTLKGNAKTSRVGINGVPRRSKVWVGINGVPHRAVSWVGINGVPHRSL